MANGIGGEPKVSYWPWGGRRTVREKLVDPAQIDRKKLAKKLGDPRRPSLPSAALIRSMGPGRTSDELRLPPPPSPYGGGTGELTPFPDRAFTRQVVERDEDSQCKALLEKVLTQISATPERLDRMRAVLERENQMLSLLRKVQADTDEVIDRMKVEYQTHGSY